MTNTAKTTLQMLFLLVSLAMLTTGCRTYNFFGSPESCKIVEGEKGYDGDHDGKVICVFSKDTPDTQKDTTGTCQDSDDCERGYTCDVGVCRLTCKSSADCSGLDHTCRCERNLCIPQNGGCTRDDQCTKGMTCQNHACLPPTCTGDSQCKQGQICEQNQCTAGCRTDRDCPTNQACLSGQCKNACQASCDCPTGQICNTKGSCELPPAKEIIKCSVDCECPSGQTCLSNGTCG